MKPTHYFLCLNCGADAFGLNLERLPKPGDPLDLRSITQHGEEPESLGGLCCQRCKARLGGQILESKRVREYLCDPDCEYCGGFGEITTDEAVYPGEPHRAPIGSKPCPRLKEARTTEE